MLVLQALLLSLIVFFLVCQFMRLRFWVYRVDLNHMWFLAEFARLEYQLVMMRVSME